MTRSAAPSKLTLPPPTAVQPGDTWHFTYWHRDAGAGGVTSNFSDAVRVTFEWHRPGGRDATRVPAARLAFFRLVVVSAQ